VGEGHRFSSETDAEIVAHLIERHDEGDLTEAVRAAFNELRGHYAFVAMHSDHPGVIVGARRECPLVVGLGDGESFVASAIPAFLAETRKAVLVENGEIVTLDSAGVAITDDGGKPVSRAVEEITWDDDAAEKSGFPTFMLKEIHEQPDAVAETIADRLPELDRVDLSELELDRDYIAGLRRIVIVACGTSYHAGLVGRYAIEQWARVPVEMDIASEYRSPTSWEVRPRATRTRSCTRAPGSRSGSRRRRPSSARSPRCICSACGSRRSAGVSATASSHA
jgi:glucosamine--fructose-6-phosphate aminotransferase (isomerizing)